MECWNWVREGNFTCTCYLSLLDYSVLINIIIIKLTALYLLLKLLSLNNVWKYFTFACKSYQVLSSWYRIRIKIDDTIITVLMMKFYFVNWIFQLICDVVFSSKRPFTFFFKFWVQQLTSKLKNKMATSVLVHNIRSNYG